LTNTAINALENACFNNKPDGNVIIYSGRRSQYTSNAYINKIQKFNLTQLFSGKVSPYDNACIESFHSILKKEEVNHKRYIDFTEAKFAIFEFIESWYNKERIHGSIDYMTPAEYEKHLKKSA